MSFSKEPVVCALLCELVQKEKLERPEVRGQLERLRLHLSVRRSRRDRDLWAAAEAPSGQGGGGVPPGDRPCLCGMPGRTRRAVRGPRC